MEMLYVICHRSYIISCAIWYIYRVQNNACFNQKLENLQLSKDNNFSSNRDIHIYREREREYVSTVNTHEKKVEKVHILYICIYILYIYIIFVFLLFFSVL